jgi:hypothetical protein
MLFETSSLLKPVYIQFVETEEWLSTPDVAESCILTHHRCVNKTLFIDIDKDEMGDFLNTLLLLGCIFVDTAAAGP